MRKSGNTSTRLVSRLRGSRLVMAMGWTVNFRGSWLLPGSSSPCPSGAALGGYAGFLLQRGDGVGELGLHAARVGGAPAEGAHAAAAQAAQRGQRAHVGEVVEAFDQHLALVARGGLLELEHGERHAIDAFALAEIVQCRGGAAAADEVAAVVRDLDQQVGRGRADALD